MTKGRGLKPSEKAKEKESSVTKAASKPDNKTDGKAGGGSPLGKKEVVPRKEKIEKKGAPGQKQMKISILEMELALLEELQWKQTMEVKPRSQNCQVLLEIQSSMTKRRRSNQSMPKSSVLRW